MLSKSSLILWELRVVVVWFGLWFWVCQSWQWLMGLFWVIRYVAMVRIWLWLLGRVVCRVFVRPIFWASWVRK